MLNFKNFLQNAATWVNGTNDNDAFDKPNLPLPSVDIPTISTNRPIRVFKVTRKGKAYEICAEDNVSWYIPEMHYRQLLHAGKAPEVNDKVTLTFYKDGSVKDFNLVKGQ